MCHDGLHQMLKNSITSGFGPGGMLLLLPQRLL